jgi:hypothetical protein
MKCRNDNFETENRKSFSNHLRWCLGKMTRESFVGINLGQANAMWMGDKVGYFALHSFIKRHLSKPLFCQDCGEKKKLDLANISGEYKRDLSDWEWLCRKCHMSKDGRLAIMQGGLRYAL